MSRALPPSEQTDLDDNMNDTLTLTRYNEEIKQNIHSIKEEQIASPWGLQQNIVEPPSFSGTSNSIEDDIVLAPLHIR